MAKKITHLIWLSCKQATELIDKKSIVALSWKDTVQLHWHTAMCTGCKAYQLQSKLIDQVLLKHIKNISKSEPIIESNEALKTKIISKL